MASKKNAFLLYKDQWEAISDLNDKTLGQLIRAIFEYQIEGKEPEKHDIIYRDFRYFKTHFDRDDAKYQLIVEKKKVAGAEGGKQKAAKLADASICYKSKHNLANVADNDNDNDNDLIITPTPSSPDGKEASGSKKTRAGKKSKAQTTLEEAIDFYKTQSAGAVLLAPPRPNPTSSWPTKSVVRKPWTAPMEWSRQSCDFQSSFTSISTRTFARSWEVTMFCGPSCWRCTTTTSNTLPSGIALTWLLRTGTRTARKSKSIPRGPSRDQLSVPLKK